MKIIFDILTEYLKGGFTSYVATCDFIDYLFSLEKPIAVPFPIKITPEIAQYIIDNYNDYNRKHTESTSSSYAKQITNGEWQLNGEAIIFLKNGKLGDGQHRMWGCIKSKTPIEVMITCGIEDSNMVTMDSGKSRSNSDCLSLINKELNKNSLLASIINCAINNIRENFAEHSASSTRSTAPTKNEIVKFYLDNKEICEQVYTYATEWKKNLPKSSHILTPREMGGFALYFILKGCTYAKVTKYFDTFVNGTYGSTTLTQSVYNKIDNTKSKDMLLRAQYLIKGWNYYANGEFGRTIKRTDSVPSLVIK